jgi:5-methylcytosine-specific restriction protein A
MPEPIATYRPYGPTPRPRLTRQQREEVSRKLYNSRAWQRARLAKLHEQPLCEPCQQEGKVTVAKHVHHKTEVRLDGELALDLANLESICPTCHAREHARRARARMHGA